MKSLEDKKGKVGSPSIVRSKSGEKRWVIYINDIIEKELNNHNPKSYISSSIFIVPKFLSATKPQDYTPQFLALGPYHHFSQEIYDNMERYKLMNVSNKLQFNFQSSLSRLSQFDLQIRASYHHRLDLDADTLALIMAIDGIFLLDFLYSKFKNCHDFLTLRGKRILSNDEVVVQDIMKLENQIPLFVLKEIFHGMIVNDEFEEAAGKLWDDLFESVLVGFCSKVSPLGGGGWVGVGVGVIECAHVLDVLYRMILPAEELEGSAEEGASRNNNNGGKSPRSEFVSFSSSMKKGNYLWKLTVDSINMLRDFKKVFNFVGRLMEVLPLVGGLVSSMGADSGDDVNKIEDKTPLMEAGIKVPTASELSDAGVIFKPSTSIKTIRFDEETLTFFLPVIKIDPNSEVILRNLVAYEAMGMPHSLTFTRYLHLMNNFIDTADDVKTLKHAQILIITGFKKDEKIASLFNGIMANNYSLGLSPSKELDQAINGVNKYYQRRPKVKANRIIKKYVYGSWRVLTLIATLLILGLLVLQSFCSVYNCPRMFGTDENGEHNS